MKVLVLGGDGFLGSHMVDRLVVPGHEVTIFDRLPEGRLQRVVRHGDRIRVVRGEFGDTAELRAALAGQELIYHFISATTPGSSWEDPEAEIAGNLAPALAFLRLAAEAGVRKIAFASSGGTVYGPSGGEAPLTEASPTRPATPYGIGKLAVEGFLWHARERHGIACDIYRIGNAYGPRQPTRGSQGVIGIWFEKLRRGEAIELFGDGGVRDYVYVRDVAELMGYSLRDLGASDLFNVGTGRGISVVELAEILRSALPVDFEVIRHPRRGFDAPAVTLDSARILERHPRFAFTPLEKGLLATWEEERGEGP